MIEPGPTDDRPDDRGQSEIIGLVLLFAAIVVGAMLTFGIGAMALQSLQDSSEADLARDTALEAHSALSQAATTGDPQEIPGGEASVDSRVIEGGTLTVTMTNGTGTCGERVHEEMGALRYSGGDRDLIYEGGGIWVDSPAGLSIERTPPISHGPEGTRISVLSVSAAATGGSGQLVAEPNASARQRIAQETEELLTRCPADGYTDLQINVTSPNHEVWNEHFEQSVDTTSNVTITNPTSQSVVATIEDVADHHPTTGLGLGQPPLEAPTALTPRDDFEAEVTVNNDDFNASDATIELAVEGTSIAPTKTITISPFGEKSTTLSVDNATLDSTLTRGTTYNYTVTVTNDSGAVVGTPNDSVTFASGGSDVELATVGDDLGPDENELTVTATLANRGLQNGTGTVTLDLVDPAVNASPQTVGPRDVNAGGETDVAYSFDVSGLPIGHYDYEVRSPNGTITDSFAISDRAAGGTVVGDVRVRDVNASAEELGTTDDFSVDADLENLANATTTADVTLDVDGLSAVGATTTLAPGQRSTVTRSVDASTLAGLEPGETHDYTLGVESDGETEELRGSFYLGATGTDLGVESVNATQDNGTVTVTATVDNDGLVNGTDDATLSASGPDGEVSFTDTPQQSVRIRPGAERTVTFSFDGSSLGGDHTFTVDFGAGSGSDTVNLGALEGGDGSVAINGAGTGTVRVLGTEVSGEWPVGGGAWAKNWAPMGATVVANQSGDENRHQFVNDETSMDLPNEHNLNTYDTQFEEWVWDWEQDTGETMQLTLSSTYWRYEGADECSTPTRNDAHTRNGPGYDEVREWYDIHPDWGYYQDDCLDPLTVDATTGDHPDNVRVLTDGDEVPDLTRGYPDQRTVAEVLNQGADDRIDPNSGVLDLSSNEAVFLFEMTDPDATWELAERTDGDPDYNDIVAIVEFEPDGDDVSVVTDTTDGGSGLVIETPTVSDSGSGDVLDLGVDTNVGDGISAGDDGDTTGEGIEAPEAPDDVDVEVDVVEVG